MFYRLFIDGEPTNQVRAFEHSPGLTSVPGGTWVAMPASEAASRAIKAEAKRRIFLLFDPTGMTPEIDVVIKEINATARMTEIVEVPPGQRTPAQAAELTAGKELFAAVKAIRARSNAIETDYGQMSDEDKQAFDPTDDVLWEQQQ